MEFKFTLTENEISMIASVLNNRTALENHQTAKKVEDADSQRVANIINSNLPAIIALFASKANDTKDVKQENPTPAAPSPIGKVYTPPKAEPDLNLKANELITSYIGRQVAVATFSPTLRDVLNVMGYHGRDLAVLLDRLVPVYGSGELTVSQLKKLSDELMVEILVPVQNHWSPVKNLHLRAVDGKTKEKKEEDDEEDGFKW